MAYHSLSSILHFLCFVCFRIMNICIYDVRLPWHIISCAITSFQDKCDSSLQVHISQSSTSERTRSLLSMSYTTSAAYSACVCCGWPTIRVRRTNIIDWKRLLSFLSYSDLTTSVSQCTKGQNTSFLEKENMLHVAKAFCGLEQSGIKPNVFIFSMTSQMSHNFFLPIYSARFLNSQIEHRKSGHTNTQWKEFSIGVTASNTVAQPEEHSPSLVTVSERSPVQIPAGLVHSLRSVIPHASLTFKC